MKSFFLNSNIIIGVILLFAMNMANSLVIDNDLSSTQGNYFSVDVQSAGKTFTLRVTDPSATITAEDIVFAYQLYVVVDGTSQLLEGTAPVLISDDKVSSSGSFTGAAGNTIEWTVESLIKDGSMQMRNTTSFTASTGTLGNIQVIQYLDQDVDGAGDDVYFSRGSVAGSNLELYVLDDNNPIAIGVSQGGAFLTEQGLINASFDGWAACIYRERAKYIDGTFTYTPSGEICSTLDNKNTTHPDIGAVKGVADTITSLAWSVEPTANQSIVVSTLGGVPDAGVVLAVDDYIDLIENTSTANSKEFNVISNDIALDTPISFQTLTAPTNGAISLNGTIVTYTPNIGFFGQDRFTYEIVDNSADTDSATVHLNVQEDSDEDGTPNVDDADAVDPCIPSNLVSACDVNNNGIADGVEASALEVIKDYADDQSSALPTQADFSNLPVTGVTVANITEINSVIASLASSDVDTVAEVQAIVNSVINSQAALNELKEDIAGNANNDLIDASELNAIRGVSGAIQANQTEYQAAFTETSPSPFVDTNNPTPAEIQAVINSVNTIVSDENTAISELVEDLNGNANTNLITANQLEDIRGVTGVISANIDEYSAAFVPAAFNDINNPTVAEINAVIASVNTIVANEAAALNELKEDIAGNANNDLVEASELNAIRGVSGALQANQAEYHAAFIAMSPSPFADTANPTPAEIQAVIDSVNTIVANETAALNELKEDIAGNANNDLVEASELNAIRGVSDAIQANQAEYQAAFTETSPSPFADSTNPAPAEIQAVIDSVNVIVANETAALDQLKEDIAGNSNSDLIDADELNAIRGVTNAIQANQAEYQAAFIATSPSLFSDPDNPTPAEIQAVIDSVNTIVANETAALNELKEDIAGNTNNDLVEASELNAIRGVSGAIQANQTEYQTAFIATSPSPFADTNNPAPAEIQAVIDSVNTIVADETAAMDELKEDIAGNANNDLVEASELNAIRGVSGAIQANQTEYQTAFIATSPSPFADTNNPTPAEIQAIIDSVNTIVADEKSAIDELKEDIAGNTNNDLVEASELLSLIHI